MRLIYHWHTYPVANFSQNTECHWAVSPLQPQVQQKLYSRRRLWCQIELVRQVSKGYTCPLNLADVELKWQHCISTGPQHTLTHTDLEDTHIQAHAKFYMCPAGSLMILSLLWGWTRWVSYMNVFDNKTTKPTLPPPPSPLYFSTAPLTSPLPVLLYSDKYFTSSTSSVIWCCFCSSLLSGMGSW